MKHFVKIADGIDVSGVVAQLKDNPSLWDAHTVRKTYDGTPHSRMSDIWVRYNAFDRFDPANHKAFNDEHVSVWYQAWGKLTALRPIIFDLMAKVEGEMIGGVLITRIPPGEGILPHADASWHVSYFSKFYLSIASAPGAFFFCEHEGETERINPKPGDIYLFDNRKVHWVENHSNHDRITCIICIRTQKPGLSQ